MTARTGQTLVAIVADDAAGLGVHFEVARAVPVFGADDPVDLTNGTQTDTQPVDENPQSWDGARLPGFVDDYYYRVHVSTLAFDFGNVVGEQVHTLYVWNAYFEERPLADITGVGNEGVDIEGERPLPTDFQPLEEITYTITVSTSGPGIISGSYTFDFDTEDITVTFEGSRITPWLWQPDGQVLERLEWLTDVITSYSGNEQRIQIREYPRRFFEFDVLLDGDDRRLAENVLYGWQARVFALPVFFDGALLPASVSAGATSITIETANRDYQDDGLIMLMVDNDTYEFADILSVNPTSLTLKRALLNAWPEGTRIFPIRLARLPDQVSLRRFNGDASYGRLRWQCVDESAYTAATESTYRSYPVLEQIPNWVEDVAHDFLRKLTWLDNRVSGITVDDDSTLPTFVQSHRWLFVDRQEIADFRAWLYARKGRLAAFWLPTWSQDLIPSTSIGAAATNIDVKHCSYTQQIASRIGRRDIRIELADGSIFYRHISGSVEVSDTVERLTINAALGVTVAPADVRMISFMALGRLDADAVEVAWWQHDVAESTVNVRSATNDL